MEKKFQIAQFIMSSRLHIPKVFNVFILKYYFYIAQSKTLSFF